MVSFSGDMSCFSNCRRWIHTIRSYKYTHFISAFLGWHFALCDAGQIWVPCYWQHLVGRKAVQLPCKYFKFSVSKLRESEWDWRKTSTIIWTRAGRPQGRLSGYLISPRHHRTWAYLCSASLQNKEPSSKYLCFQSISGKKKKAAAENSNLALNKCFLQTSDDAFRPCLTPPKVCTQNSPHPRLAGCYWHQCHFYGYWH